VFEKPVVRQISTFFFGRLVRGRMRPVFIAAIGVLSFSAAFGAARSASSEGNSTEWPFLGGGVESQQFSTLKQIDSTNVSVLGLLRYTNLPVKEGLVGNTLIKDEIAYQSTPRAGAIAVALRTGKVVWTFEPAFDYTNTSLLSMWTSHNTRGLGMDAERIFTANGCYLFAVDRRNGVQLWRTQICDPSRDRGTSSAPRVGGGKVFVGVQVGEAAGRGYAAAFDAKSGKEIWRFYTVPGDPSKPFENPQMEAASRTWGADYWEKSKGGDAAGVWEGMIYDPVTDFLIFGTGNPMPHDPAWLAAHDNLFSDSVIAVNASTGKYAWHYQALPGDAWGFGDATGHMVLAELTFPAGKRRVLMSAEKQLFYVLDARTGAFISAGAYVPNTNLTVDPKTGRPKVRDALRAWEHPGRTETTQPGADGGHSWTLSAYNPQTGLVYIPAFIIPGRVGAREEESDASLKQQGRLVAWDPVTQQERWHVDQTQVINGGVLATAGDLVFQGTAGGSFYAYDGRTGQEVWSFDTQSIIEAAPSTVMLDGAQVLVVPAGDASGNGTVRYFPAAATTARTLMAPSRLLVFGLGGKANLPPTAMKILPKPALERPTAAVAAAGAAVFGRNQCSLCHASGLQISGQGRIPDLRAITAEQLDAMPSILRQGVLMPLGMPRFPNISDDEIKQLQAYIEMRAWEDYDKQQSSRGAN